MNWWMRFCEHNKGSISIFLSAILLPFLWLIGILVDDSNLNLSIASVEGAGELTVNAALANYDSVLADVYGLYAMSQSSEDDNLGLESYFRDSLHAGELMQAVDADSELGQAVVDGSQDLLGLTRAEDVTRNFVDVEYSNFTAGGLPGSSLANPEILKSQIVEFMKYRGPADIGMSLLDSLGVFKKVGEQAKVLKEKMNTDQKVATLAEESQRLYDAIVHLDQLLTDYLAMRDSFYPGGLNTVRTCLEEADKIIREQLASAATVDDLPNIKKNKERTEYQGETYYTFKMSGVSAKKLTADYTLSDARSDLNNALNSFNLSRMESAVTQLGTMDSDTLSSLFSKYRSFGEDMKQLCQAILTLEAHGETKWEEGKQLSGDALAVQEGWMLLTEAYEEVVTPFEDKAQTYDSELAEIRKEVGEKVLTAARTIQDYQGSAKEMAGKEVASSAAEYIARLLGIISSALDSVLQQVDRVRNAMNQVSDATASLETEAEKYKSNTSEDDFYAGIKSQVEQNKQNFTTQDLDAIESQIRAIKTYLGDEDSGEIGRLNHDCTLYGRSLTDISTKKSSDAIGRQTLKDYKKYTGSPGYQLISGEQRQTKDCYVKPIGSEVLKLDDGTTVAPPAYYVYMDCNYTSGEGEKNDDNLDQTAENVNEMAGEETAASDGDATGSQAGSASVFADAPSGSIGGGGAKDYGELGSGNTAILGQLASMMDLVINLVSGIDDFLENGRDNLLVTQYVDSNFSCATKKDDQGLTTMTNVPINTKNNPLMGCEMEYIIYGDKGDKAQKFFFITLSDAPGPAINVSYAKNNILAIRFACNAIVAITNGQINNLTRPPALAIQAATCGIFPYKVAQVVIDVCLAYAESLSDLSRLMNGEKVELIKNYDSWTMKPETLLDPDTIKTVTKDTINSMSQGVQEIVTNNIQQLIDESADRLKGNGADLLREVNREVQTMVQSSINSCTQTLQTLLVDRVDQMFTKGIQQGITWTKDTVRAQLTEAAAPYLESLNGAEIQPFAQQALSAMVDALVDDNTLVKALNDKAKQLDDTVQSCAALANEKIAGALTNIRQLISDEVNSISAKINGELESVVDGASAELKDATEETVAQVTQQLSEDVSNTINGQLNKYFPKNEQQGTTTTEDGEGKNSGLGEAFKFSYQDYLRVFLFLELNRNSDAVMLRIADVIQVNLGQGMQDYGATALGKDGATAAHAKGGDFRMAEAYTYAQITADIQLNPLLLSNRLFSFDGSTGLGLWKYHYETIKGY